MSMKRTRSQVVFTPKRDKRQPKRRRIVKSSVQGLIASSRSEAKVIDFFDNISPTSAGIVRTSVSSFSSGTGYRNQFVGRTLFPISLDIRLQIVGPGGAVAPTDQFDSVRLVVFQWMGNLAPTVATVLQTASNISPILEDSKNDLNILADRMYPLWCTSALTNFNSWNSYMERIFIKGRRMVPINMNSTPVFVSGGLYYLAIANSAAAPVPQVGITFRITFLDS